MHAPKLCLAPLLCLALIACSGPDDTDPVMPEVLEWKNITGTVSYRERIRLNPAAIVTVSLEDVSRADAPAIMVAQHIIEAPGQVPVKFELMYNPAIIDERMSYSVRATIYEGGEARFITDMAYPALTRGAGDSIELVLVAAAGNPSFFDTYWELSSIRGETEMLTSNEQKPNIMFHTEGGVSGFSGCNSYTGQYTEADDQLELGNLMMTMKACTKTGNMELRFMQALNESINYKVMGTQLRTYNGEQEELLIFNAVAAEKAAPANAVERTPE